MGEDERREQWLASRAHVLSQVEEEVADSPDGPEGFDLDGIVDEVMEATGGDVNGLPPYAFWKIVFGHEKRVEVTPEVAVKTDDLLLS